jgi:hypothetical protein
LVVAGSLVGLLELGSLLTYRVLFGTPFSYRQVRRERHQLFRSRPAGEGQPGQGRASIYTLHPYLGYTFDPEGTGPLLQKYPVTKYGFCDKGPPVHKRSPDKVIIGVVGGSVASIFAEEGAASLTRALRAGPGYAGKDVVLVNLAIYAYKQPQQVMALNYALALGAEFDVLLNIDGFNEVAFYPPDNAPLGVFPLFPNRWPQFVQDVPDPEARLLAGEVAYLERQRVKWAGLFRAPLGLSVTLNLLWKLRDRALEADGGRCACALQKVPPARQRYCAVGPGRTWADEGEMYGQLAGAWKRCSVQLDRVCRAYGIRYYHFLQPNQYLPGSKPMGDEERRVAFLESTVVKAPVEQGYPLLRKEGATLPTLGVRYRDLTQLFAGRTEVLYRDNCCHVNQAGNEVLAEAVAGALLETPEPPSGIPTR